MGRLILLVVFGAVSVVAPACKKPDPNQFETHVERISDPKSRASGFSGLEQLTKTVVTARDNRDRIEDFAAKVIPAFEGIWSEAPEQHESMLKLLLDVGHEAGHSIWNRALALDGSADGRKKTILALEGIKKAHAAASVEAVVKQFDGVIANPKLDQAKGEVGGIRTLMAETLGILGVSSAVPVLVKAMEQTVDDQPVTVHRAAADALGQIGDPSAIDALLAATFRVPDAPTSRNLAERTKVALVAIGEPAVSKVLQMLRGEHADVQALAARNGVNQFAIQQTAAHILGALGSKAAVDDLLDLMPDEDCRRQGASGAVDPAQIGLRAFIANALGWIGDPRASTRLCSCVFATKNPGDMYPILEALGRMGGPEASRCLLDVVNKGAYAADVVADASFVYEPRWQAGRWAILAAKPEAAATLKGAFAKQADPKVKTELARLTPGLDVLETCRDDRACYERLLVDASADWFARETAAYALSRLAVGNVAVAHNIAKAFKVRNPTARVSMAWLPAHMLAGKRCQPCVDAYEEVLHAEKLSMGAEYQLSVLTARSTIAKLGERASISQ